MYKMGDKVVPHSKSVGWSLESSNNWRMAKELGQKYLYLVGFDDNDKVTCSAYEDGSGDFFLESDLTLYKEESENGLFQEFSGLKYTELMVKDLIDLVDKGIVKETDIIIVGRK